MNYLDSVYNLMRTADIVKRQAKRKEITDSELNKIKSHLTKLNLIFTDDEIKKSYQLVTGL